jgi:predicted site-specific integrase-resolvase
MPSCVRVFTDTRRSHLSKELPAWLPYARYAERKGVTTKTLDRWVAKGILPPPKRVNNRKYLDENIQPRQDRETEAAS